MLAAWHKRRIEMITEGLGPGTGTGAPMEFEKLLAKLSLDDPNFKSSEVAGNTVKSIVDKELYADVKDLSILDIVADEEE